jgi:hypothetical protein
MISAQGWCRISSANISMQVPTFFFPIHDYFSNFVMMPNQHTLPLFQQQSPPKQSLESEILLYYFWLKSLVPQIHSQLSSIETSPVSLSFLFSRNSSYGSRKYVQNLLIEP